MAKRSWASRSAGSTFGFLASVGLFGAQGCLDRPVVPIVPGGSGVIATKIRVTRIDKVDLLMIIDNSLSMGDKQSELSRRVPQLVKELTNPDIDPATGKPKFLAVADLHIGVLSSSLGSQGTSACDPGSTTPHNNDHGHLLPRPGEGGGSGWTISKDDQKVPDAASCPTPIAATALSWVNDPAKDPKAMFNGGGGTTQMQAAASCVVASVKEDGCGYEETWESMYHFLVDPTPYAKAEAKCTFGVSGDNCTTGGKPNPIEVSGIDADVLKERAQFLRPDSLLAVVILSDENDFSLKPAQLNWLPYGYGAGQMQRGWGACANVPDDFEPETAGEYNDLHTKYGCKSCFEDTSDPNCAVPWAKDKKNNDPDDRNLRGFDMTQRFGYNFLWSRARYVNAFKSTVVPGVDATGAIVGLPNPVLDGGFRSPDLIVVAGIVGVPGKLVGDPTAADKYAFTPKTLTEADWEKIISPDLTKRDPHMIESIGPRDKYGIKHYGGDRTIDDVNGGDRDVDNGDDLQFACIAPRAVTDKTSDCEGANPETKSPLCDAGGKQPFFKAYPGLRHLRILHDLGTSGFAASLCADTYAPAIQGIIDKLQAALNSQCFKSVLTQGAEGRVDCLILESFADAAPGGKGKCEDIGKGYCTPGAAPCRVDGSLTFPVLPPDAAAGQLNLNITIVKVVGAGTIAVQEKVQATSDGGNVYAAGSDGKKHLVCEMQEINTTTACLNDPAFTLPPGQGGWCYTTAEAVVGDACRKIGAVGSIRFNGDTQPKNGSEVFTLCQNSNAPAAAATK